MAVAMIYPEGKRGGRKDREGSNPKNLGLSDELIRHARTVLAYSRPLAQKVVAGSKLLAG
jgi:hypothetical protein